MLSSLLTMQFGFPLLGAIALLSPLLVFAYLRKNRLTPMTVSSILLLRALKTRPSLKQKFKPPLRFYIELLLLACLALALTLPSYRADARRVALVIDTSLSMRATEPDGRTRFEHAREKAEDWLDKASAETRVTLFASAPGLEQQGKSLVSPSEAAALLGGTKPSYSSDALELSLPDLERSGTFEQVVIVSDRPLDQATTNPSKTTFESIVVGTPVANVALTSIRLQKGSIEQGQSRVVVGVRNFGPEKVSGTVALQQQSNSVDTAAETMLTRFTLLPKQNQEFIFSVGEVLEQAYKGSIQVEATQNLLSEDDAAWISLSSNFNTKALLVSPLEDRTFTLGLEQLPFLEVARTTPLAYAKLDPGNFDLIIFHRTAPSRLPSVSSLFILPPAENSFLPIAKELSNPQLTSWREEHPFFSYLKVPLLTPQSATVFGSNSWSYPLLFSQAGPLLLAGETQGARFAALGFEILPFEGARTPAPSILLLNIVNWALQSEAFSEGLNTGMVFQQEDGFVGSLLGPEKTHFELPSKEKIRLALPGLYQVSGKLDGAVIKERNLAVNVFHAAESATFETPLLTLPEAQANQRALIRADTPLWNSLLKAALLLFLLLLVLSVLSQRSRQLDEAK